NRADTPENGITVRKAPEAGNHPMMRLGIFQKADERWAVRLILLGQQNRESLYRALLMLQVFGMLKHHVAEHPLKGRQTTIPAVLEATLQQGQGTGVTREGTWRVAMNHSRQLVEQQHQVQPAF